MPIAGGSISAGVKYHYEDHDSDVVNMAPPVQNVWYEVFHAQDVRLIWCRFIQTNDETDAKNIAIRWTVDGQVYFSTVAIVNNTPTFVYRNWLPSAVGTGGLSFDPDKHLAAYYTDKRGQDFKVEIRITDVPGTNQTLDCWCVRETLEET